MGGYGHYQDEQVYKVFPSLFFTSEHHTVEDSLKKEIRMSPLPLSRRYYFANKAIMNIMPLLKDEYLKIIEEMKILNK